MVTSRLPAVTMPNLKLHAVVNEHGKPLILLLTEGQMNDHLGAKLMYESLPTSASHLIGDKGCDSEEFRAALNAKRIEPCIPRRKNRILQISYCRKLYKSRHKVEIMFGKLKDWRRLATRYA